MLQSNICFLKSLCAYENILATGSWDNSVIIWDLNNGNRLAKLEGHTEGKFKI